ncbi:MAG: preprotein translocase subunit YajC [Robiginitomaculum sp.]|nr:MAG: preprotein translocase subunit YajC [Robiginitomaculum sp.]
MLNLIMQAAPAGAPPNLIQSILPFILIGFVFYFLLIRPQNKRAKEHKAMLAAVVRGDTVVTNGGLIGKVTKVKDNELTLDLGAGVKVKVVAGMLADVRNKTEAANDTAKK